MANGNKAFMIPQQKVWEMYWFTQHPLEYHNIYRASPEGKLVLDNDRLESMGQLGKSWSKRATPSDALTFPIEELPMRQNPSA